MTFASYAQTADTLKSGKVKPYLIPNTEILITPPAHFKFVEKINGFIHLGSSASITATAVDGTSYLQVAEGLTSEYFNTQNAVLISCEDVKTALGMEGKLYTLSFQTTSNDTSKKVLQFERMMFFTGDYNRTIWLTANYPALLKKLLYPVLRESLLTVKFNDSK
ncbi:MAG: hypothetical protein HY951_16145 [Bacteroidia bacterium]|nr:hypothetical protein [Bacteroidia bacterium]